MEENQLCCILCGKDSNHPSSARTCLTFMRKCDNFDEHYPENTMPCFPTDNPAMWVLHPKKLSWAPPAPTPWIDDWGMQPTPEPIQWQADLRDFIWPSQQQWPKPASQNNNSQWSDSEWTAHHWTMLNYASGNKTFENWMLPRQPCLLAPNQKIRTSWPYKNLSLTTWTRHGHLTTGLYITPTLTVMMEPHIWGPLS